MIISAALSANLKSNMDMQRNSIDKDIQKRKM